MKRLIFSVVVLLISAVTTQAQTAFRHWSVGVEAGTSGVGIDVATTISDHFQLRAGYNFMPRIKYTNNVDLETLTGYSVNAIPSALLEAFNTYTGYDLSSALADGIEVEGRLLMNDFKLLADYYPSTRSSFHVTAGVFIGSESVVEASNSDQYASLLANVYQWNQYCLSTPRMEQYELGVSIGERFITPDANGRARAELRANAVKPYLGIGFGRAVPKTKRVSFMFELGCKFWGTPKIYEDGTEVTTEELQGEDEGWFEKLHKVKVYPHLAFRLCGRIL